MMIMMMMMRRRLACCSGEREAGLDFEEQERIMRYNGLETCILSSAQSYENESGTSRGDGCTADSTDEDDSSWSSSKDGFGSFSSRWMMKRDDEWEFSESPRHFYVKENPNYVTCYSDVETMKERFAKLLLGEDVSGGSKALSTALALSNAITNLAASVFGEMWKLEPLPQERKNRWRREMEWLLSPAKYMVELVPAKQKGANGNTVEIMIPKVRKDIDMNLPALQKLDSLLIEMLDSMVNTEFWYMEGGSRAEGRTSHARHGKKWWLPSAQVPTVGLSDSERAKLLYKSKVVHQVFKAAKSINQNVLQEMPVPTAVRDALPKSGKASLGEELYRILSAQSSSPEEMLKSVNLKSEHRALETMNRLEGAMFQWEQKVKEQTGGKSPMRTSWSFMKDPLSEVDRMELLFNRAEALLQQLKSTYQNLPQTFLEVTKIQYGKDIGHSILEAYSRVLGNLAFSMLSRIGDILQEDVLSNPNSPLAKSYVPGTIPTGALGTPVVCSRVRHSLIDQMNKVDGKVRHSDDTATSDTENSPEEAKMSSVTATPCRSRVWCIGREACGSNSPPNSP